MFSPTDNHLSDEDRADEDVEELSTDTHIPRSLAYRSPSQGHHQPFQFLWIMEDNQVIIHSMEDILSDSKPSRADIHSAIGRKKILKQVKLMIADKRMNEDFATANGYNSPIDAELWGLSSTFQSAQGLESAVAVSASSDCRFWLEGFDTKIFAKSFRLMGGTRKPIGLRYRLSGTAEICEDYFRPSQIYHRQKTAFKVIMDMVSSVVNHTEDIEDEFKAVAANFFKAHTTNTSSIFVTKNESPWRMFLEEVISAADAESTLDRPVAPFKNREHRAMGLFLQDVIMANELERACVKRQKVNDACVERCSVATEVRKVLDEVQSLSGNDSLKVIDLIEQIFTEAERKRNTRSPERLALTFGDWEEVEDLDESENTHEMERCNTDDVEAAQTTSLELLNELEVEAAETASREFLNELEVEATAELAKSLKRSTKRKSKKRRVKVGEGLVNSEPQDDISAQLTPNSVGFGRGGSRHQSASGEVPQQDLAFVRSSDEASSKPSQRTLSTTIELLNPESWQLVRARPPPSKLVLNNCNKTSTSQDGHVSRRGPSIQSLSFEDRNPLAHSRSQGKLHGKHMTNRYNGSSSISQNSQSVTTADSSPNHKALSHFITHIKSSEEFPPLGNGRPIQNEPESSQKKGNVEPEPNFDSQKITSSNSALIDSLEEDCLPGECEESFQYSPVTRQFEEMPQTPTLHAKEICTKLFEIMDQEGSLGDTSTMVMDNTQPQLEGDPSSSNSCLLLEVDTNSHPTPEEPTDHLLSWAADTLSLPTDRRKFGRYSSLPPMLQENAEDRPQTPDLLEIGRPRSKTITTTNTGLENHKTLMIDLIKPKMVISNRVLVTNAPAVTEENAERIDDELALTSQKIPRTSDQTSTPHDQLEHQVMAQQHSSADFVDIYAPASNPSLQNVPTFHSHGQHLDSQIGSPSHPSSSASFVCTYCHAVFTPSPVNPLFLCPGCGPNGYEPRYCSRECLLVDAYKHAADCACYPAHNRLFEAILPTQYCNFEMYPPMSAGIASSELFRQRTFSLYCRYGSFPRLSDAWCRRHPDYPYQRELRELDDQMSTGIYYVFASQDCTQERRVNIAADIIYAVAFSDGDPFRRILSRVLNALYVHTEQAQLHKPLAQFAFRAINYFLHNQHLYDRCNPSNTPIEILCETFYNQFYLEFGFDSYMDTFYMMPFDLERETVLVMPYLINVEVAFPVLRRWDMD